MFDKRKERFVIGEELTIEEFEYLAKLSRNKPSGLNLSREENLLLKYCYAITNSSFYMFNKDGQEFARMKNDDTKQAMFDMFVYTVNMQAVSGVSLSEGLVITENSVLPALFGAYDQDIIEFALLQEGIRIQCDSQAFEDVDTSRLSYGKKYNLEQGKPVSANDLADSIQMKLEALDEKEIEY